VEKGPALLRQIRPMHRHRNGLHMNDAAHAFAMRARPVKSERGAPIIKNKYYAIAEIERLPQREKKVPVLGIVITVRTRRAKLL